MSVSVARVPSGYKDLTEWVAAGATKEQFQQILRSAQPWSDVSDGYPPDADDACDTPHAHNGSDAISVRPSLGEAVLSYEEILRMKIPPRKRHVAWLSEGGNVMVFGPRGVGKTMLQLALTAALTTGRDFWKWPVSEPVGVLYVDGEMALDELRERSTAFLDVPPKASLLFLTSEYVYHKLHLDLVLTSEAMREEIVGILDVHPDIRVVILDNVSTLFAGIDEDKKKDWEPIGAWLIRLRHRRLATVIVHHAGKDGRQRGTSGREDALDTVIRLDYPSEYDPQEGCHFELHFTKSRSVKGEAVAPLDVKLEEREDDLRWVFKPLEKSKEEQVQALLDEGMTKAEDIADALGIDRSYAWRLIRKLDKKGN